MQRHRRHYVRLLLFCALFVAVPRPAQAQVVDVGTWSRLPEAGAPSPRASQAAVWTGRAMLIWGGEHNAEPLGDGARYDPATQTWRPISLAGAPAPRYDQAVIWTGREMIVFGGQGAGVGGRYDPTTDAWQSLPAAGAPPTAQPLAVWTGSTMLVWGSDFSHGNRAADAGYAPATNTWTPMSPLGAPSPRFNATAVWTGKELLVWGGDGNGSPFGGPTYLNDGARYSPADDSWTAISTSGAPSPRELQTAVWTGRALLVWGGIGRSGCCRDGAAYDPATNTWRAIPPYTGPLRNVGATSVWTGREMLVWGGDGGAAYDPATNRWTALATVGAPSPRFGQTAIWTGQQMLIWGGRTASRQTAEGSLNDGAAYTPSAPPACRFVLGFAAMHDTIPSVVGDCLENEQHSPVNGDGFQHTTNGLLVWRKADNVTAFTDGYRTWVNGPDGIRERLNVQRFPWEANSAGLPLVR